MTVAAAEAPLLALPPRPTRPLSTWQLLKAFRTNALSAWDEALFEELIVERRIGWFRFVVVSDPDGLRRILQDNYDNYPRLHALRRLFEFETGSGIFYTEGDKWRRHRRLLNQTLDARALADDFPLLVELTEEMCRRLAALRRDEVIDIGAAFSHLVMRSNRLVFSTHDQEMEPILDKMAHYPLRPSLLHFVALPEWVPFARPHRASRALASGFQPLLDTLLAKRRAPGYDGRHDLIWRLIHAGEGGGAGLDDAELRDEIITLAATAYTVLRPLTWLWYLLALHPDVETRLHHEIEAVLGERPPALDDLSKLVYVRQVLNETMRLYPPLPVMTLRGVTAADTVCGRRIAPNSVVAIIPWALHRHRKLWQDPDRFDPDRFGPEQSAARSRYAFLPFGIGPHVCIGAQITNMQMMVTVAMLAQRFRFRLVPGQQIEPTAWLNLRPKRAINMTVEPRAAAGVPLAAAS